MLRKVSIIITFLIINLGYSQQSASSAGTSSNLLLRFDTSAKAAALSGAYTGLASDEHAFHYNPAGITQLYHGVAGLNHTEWLENIRIDDITYVQPFYRQFAFGISLTHMWMPSFEGKDQYGNSAGTVEVSSSIAKVAFAYEPHNVISLGANVKYFQDNLAGYKATGFAYDFGLHFRPLRNILSIGAVVQNIGSGIRYNKEEQNIPLTYRAGFGLKFFKSSLEIGADVSKAIDTDMRYHLGVNYTYKRMISFRLGNRSSANQLLLPSFGLGLLVQNKFQIDYTFSKLENLGLTHRVGLSFHIGSGSRYRIFSSSSKTVYPPSQLMASIKEQKLHLEWKEMYAVKYNVYARFGLTGTWTKLNKEALSKNFFNSNIPLKAGTYYFKITAVRQGKESAPSQTATIHIKDENPS